MPVWIVVALSLIWVLWGLLEWFAFLGVHRHNRSASLLGKKPLRYSRSGTLVSVLFGLFTILWFSWLLFGDL